jgi:hypothetical protein
VIVTKFTQLQLSELSNRLCQIYTPITISEMSSSSDKNWIFPLLPPRAEEVTVEEEELGVQGGVGGIRSR